MSYRNDYCTYILYVPHLRYGMDCNLIFASPLLRLPAELRNKVYEYTFAGIIVRIRGLGMKVLERSPTGPLSLLYTSRQIKSEANSIYLASCTFDLVYIILVWLMNDDLRQVVGAYNLGLMTSLSLTSRQMLTFGDDVEWYNGALLCNVKDVHIRVPNDKWDENTQWYKEGSFDEGLLEWVGFCLKKEDVVFTFGLMSNSA